MRYANIYIYIFVLHRGFFQQPRGRVAPRLGRVARRPQLGRQSAVCYTINSDMLYNIRVEKTRLRRTAYICILN